MGALEGLRLADAPLVARRLAHPAAAAGAAAGAADAPTLAAQVRNTVGPEPTAGGQYSGCRGAGAPNAEPYAVEPEALRCEAQSPAGRVTGLNPEH